MAFAYSVWTVIGSGAQTVLYGFVLLLIGIPVYVWMRKQQSDVALKAEGTTSNASLKAEEGTSNSGQAKETASSGGQAA